MCNRNNYRWVFSLAPSIKKAEGLRHQVGTAVLFNCRNISDYWAMLVSRFRTAHNSEPLHDIDRVEEFVTSRAAFIAQKTLYGYVKTRMGTRYPDMFKNDDIIGSLNIAKMHVFAACLSDLTIFAVDKAIAGSDTESMLRCAIAERIFAKGLRDNPEPSVTDFSAEDALDEFRQRLRTVDWGGKAGTRESFSQSPAAVMKWAPIADNLKALDTEYAENSVKFAWINVRDQFKKRLDAAAVTADAATRQTSLMKGATLQGAQGASSQP